MNKFIILNPTIYKNKIIFNYIVKGKWKKYINQKEQFFIEYSCNISDIPKSICIIPLLADILPLAWIFDATIEIDELDKDFYNSINEFKKGYIQMYKNIEFKGNLKVKTLVDNSYATSKNVGAFFSGGVDATSTLITHLKEKPILINIQGSDIDINNDEAINNVKQDILTTASKFDLETFFVKSNFRKLIKHKKLDLMYLRKISNDNYWHGFQHGIAIISHAAPIAYLKKLKTVYIASSFTKGMKNVTCASDPTIDNYVKLASTNIFHDGYELNRGEKIQNIGEFIKNNNIDLKVRVCFDETVSDNCCHCEKCYRTIAEAESLGYDAHLFGFKYDETLYRNMEYDLKNNIIIGHVRFWNKIKNEFKNAEKINPHYKWMLEYDFEKNNKNYKKYLNKLRKITPKKIKNYFK